MKVAAAYIRVSTDDQIEFSPDSQLEKIKLYAERNQMLLPKEFIFMDEGISGRNTKKRPAFNTMILNMDMCVFLLSIRILHGKCLK